MRRHLTYLFLELKAAFRIIPRLFSGMLLFAILASCIGYAGVRMQTGSDHLYFKVAAVLPENDALVNLGFNMLTEMESLKDYCEFIPTDKENAEAMMKKGEVYGIVYIPQGFVEDVLSGRNTPAKVVLPDNPGIETALFRSVLNAGSSTLAYVQSGIYAMTDTYNRFGLSDRIAESSDELNRKYIRFVMNRSDIFDMHTVRATGALTQAQFYVCSGITIVMLFIGFLLGGFCTQEKSQLFMLLKRAGIGRAYICGSRTLAVSVSCTCILLPLLAAVRILLLRTPDSSGAVGELVYNMSFSGIICIFVCMEIAASYILLVYTIAGNGFYGMLLLFCSNMSMLYCSGLIIPSAYLPKAASLIGKLLPAAPLGSLLETIYIGTIKPASLVLGISYIILFTLLSALIGRPWGNKG